MTSPNELGEVAPVEAKNFIAPETEATETKKIKAELAELGLEALEENIEAVRALKNTRQIPEGYSGVIDAIKSGDAEEIKKAMTAAKIKSVVHSEGETVWDHAKLGIQLVGAGEENKDMRALMLFHDLGKTKVARSKENVDATAKKLTKGELHGSMIKHAETGLDEIRKGLEANGIFGEKLESFMLVVKNHMATNILEQDPKKTVALIDTFGADDIKRREVVELLAKVLEHDANSTEHVDLKDGKVEFSKNEKKLQMSADAIWKKYEEGRALIKKAEAEELKKKAETAREMDIFGGKLSDYLIGRGIKPGPEMGKASGKIKKVLQENQTTVAADVKKLIDGMSL